MDKIGKIVIMVILELVIVLPCRIIELAMECVSNYNKERRARQSNP